MRVVREGTVPPDPRNQLGSLKLEISPVNCYLNLFMSIKKLFSTLAGVAQWIECWPMN